MGNKPLGTVFWIFAVIGVLLTLIIIAGLIGSIGYKPAIDPNAVQNYYGQLKTLSTTVNSAYAVAAKKATQGDIKGAYAEFKSPVRTMVRNAIITLQSLKNQAPDGPDKKLLEDAATNLWLSFGQRDDAISLFIEGVEKSEQGKFLEARLKSDKADNYLSIALAALDEISSKYGIEK